MLSARSIEIIESSPGWRRHRIEFFDLPEGRMVVKGQRPARGPWAHRVLNGIAALAGVPCLKAVPVHGGQKAQDVEVRRLRALAAVGVRVPKVLHVAQDYFVMENMGSTNLVCQLAEGGEIARQAWLRCAQYVLDAHMAGVYFSQCFARNLIMLPQGVGAIDFEDDPLEVMNLTDAQARDWLAFFQSSLWLLDVSHRWIDEQLDFILSQETPKVQRALALAANRLAWLRHLSNNRKLWGRDGIAIRAAALHLHRYRLRHP